MSVSLRTALADGFNETDFRCLMIYGLIAGGSDANVGIFPRPLRRHYGAPGVFMTCPSSVRGGIILCPRWYYIVSEVGRLQAIEFSPLSKASLIWLAKILLPACLGKNIPFIIVRTQ